MEVNILGTIYTVQVKKYAEDKAFERDSVCGYCDGWSKRIVLCDMETYKGFEEEPKDSLDRVQKGNLRHEIVHAFLNESGLMDDAGIYNGAWVRNEELVDWIALQGQKIYAAWKEADCLG